jgi:hypothetical protein
MNVPQAVRAFLDTQRATHPNPSILDFDTDAMEFQVVVDPGNGQLVPGRGHTYSDGFNEWWPIHSPKGSFTDQPKPLTYDLHWPLELHATAIGPSGWNWRKQQTEFVGFDFDSISGHADGVGITDEKLAEVQTAAPAYVEVRRSTGGRGLHLIVPLDNIPTRTHTQHAELARAVLRKLAADTGYDFQANVDATGLILFVWARRQTPDSFQLLKAAERKLASDEIDFTPSESRTVQQPSNDIWTMLTSPYFNVALDDQHKAHMDAIHRAGFVCVWDEKEHRLQTHTKGFEHVAKVLRIQGYETTSPGTKPQSINCWAVPRDKGGWKLFRYSQGVVEAPTWEQDGEGYTTCLFNVAARKSKLTHIRASDMPRLFSKPRRDVIKGLIRVGDVANFVGGPKARKSFLASQMALCVAAGIPFLGWPTVQSRVAYYDNELRGDDLFKRLKSQADSLKLDWETVAPNIEVVLLRGVEADLNDIREDLSGYDQGTFGLVVVDALYKSLPQGAEENSNDSMKTAYVILDATAEEQDCGLAIVHHFAKGNATKKSVTDLGAGAGAQSRSADCHIVLKDHKDKNTVVLEGVLRSQPPLESRCLEFVFPVWTVASEKDPDELATVGVKAKPSIDEFLAALPDKPTAKTEILEAVRIKLNTSKDAIKALVAEAKQRGQVEIDILPGRGGKQSIRRLKGAA